MTRQPPPLKSQRLGVLMGVIALHVAMLVAFLASGGSPAPPPLKTGVTSIVSISAEQPANRPPPPPKLPSKVVDEIKKLTAQALTFEPDSTALAAAPGQCATLDVVSKAITADSSAVEAVIQAPPEARSIAEAIVMWNAGWSNAASTPDSPLAPARTIVELSLNSIEDGCLDEQIAGPRLIPVPVPDGQRTMFLVFGSGSWTWRELLADSALAKGATPADRRAKAWYELDWFQVN